MLPINRKTGKHLVILNRCQAHSVCSKKPLPHQIPVQWGALEQSFAGPFAQNGVVVARAQAFSWPDNPQILMRENLARLRRFFSSHSTAVR